MYYLFGREFESLQLHILDSNCLIFQAVIFLS